MGERDPLTIPFATIERGTRYSHPQVGIDGRGRVWLTYLQKFGNRTSTRLGSYWLLFARRLEGDRWSEPVEVHHSDGMMDARPVLLPHPAGGLRIVHHADNRYTAPTDIATRVYASTIDLPGDPGEPKLVPHEAGAKGDKARAQGRTEREAVERVRAYRVEAGGRAYRLLRGEFHRHTEFSWDGGPVLRRQVHRGEQAIGVRRGGGSSASSSAAVNDVALGLEDAVRPRCAALADAAVGRHQHRARIGIGRARRRLAARG